MVNLYTALGVFLGFILTVQYAVAVEPVPITTYTSSEVEYTFPSLTAKNQAIASQQYIRGNSILIDVQPQYYSNGAYRVFVTVPKFNKGVPISLGTVSTNNGAYGKEIYPYPNYSWHSNQDPSCPVNRIVSAFRVQIDECGRLWVLDSGKIEETQVCQPKLLVFNIANDALIHSFVIPANLYRDVSLLITPVSDVAVDVRDPLGTCTDTYVYMADVTGFALVAYSMKYARAWRVTNKAFFADPNFGEHTINGKSFELMDGVLGLALSPRQYKSGTGASTTFYDRALLFHSLAGNKEYVVNTTILNDFNGWAAGTVDRLQFKLLGTRPGEATAQAIDKNGNLFFGMIHPVGDRPVIACWNIYNPYTNANIKYLLTSSDIQFTSGLKIVTDNYGYENLWFLGNRFEDFATGTVSLAKVNFRIQTIKISTLLGGWTIC